MAKDNRRNLVSHPGEILKDEFLQPLGISVYALSAAMGVPRTRMNDIVLGRRGITADTAIRLGKFFGSEPQSWLNLQQRYDLIIAETEPYNTLSCVRTLKEVTDAGDFLA
ncbi:MAG: HigA family addiction module antitoxin [Rickettsiales bacterium]